MSARYSTIIPTLAVLVLPLVLALVMPATSSSSGVSAASANLSPCLTGSFRWLDINDQAYGASYRSSYNYAQARVMVEYSSLGTVLQGTLRAANLKPSFAYQLKLEGLPDDPDPVARSANERIGMVGRYWRETWDGSSWASGQNLNNKGDGSRPSPNDSAYLTGRNLTHQGGHDLYRHVGYVVFGYFVTDPDGSAEVSFSVNSSYHVLWKALQRSPTAMDGPIISTSFYPAACGAYDHDYGPSTVEIFGEWERLPVGGVDFLPGEYRCLIVLTEESFHGAGLAGGWARAMEGEITFTIIGVAWERPDGYLSPDWVVPGESLCFEGDAGDADWDQLSLRVTDPFGSLVEVPGSGAGRGGFDTLVDFSFSPGSYDFTGPPGQYTVSLMEGSKVVGSDTVCLVAGAPTGGLLSMGLIICLVRGVRAGLQRTMS